MLDFLGEPTVFLDERLSRTMFRLGLGASSAVSTSGGRRVVTRDRPSGTFL